jgi:outer membrane protein assembly factor BamB
VTELPTGTRTDFVGYRVEEAIGRGGMGVVYRAHDLRLKRPVALKLIVPELAPDERFRERFARETELAMSLEHPNVVPIYDAGDVDGRLYLAMRLVAGSDLAKLLRTQGALEPTRALAICRQVAGALDAAHAKGLVHRDVKPSNVLLDENEHVYLADFGLTRTLDEQGALGTDSRSVGTPAYLAPEQIEGGSVDGRVDVYALGCVLFECLTGASPFARGSRLETAWAHLEEEPPSARALVPDLPEAIDPVLRTALAKEPDDRYLTSTALISAAEHAFGLGRSTPLHRRKPVLLIAAVTLLLLAAVTAAAVLATQSQGKPPTPAAPVFARPDSLVRIDPATNKVSAVIDVGPHPVVVAAAGHSVWTYNKNGSTISEVDARTNRVLKTTTIAASPAFPCCSLFTGPVLAADASGAWFVNGGAYDQPRLTHIPFGAGRTREYSLDITPTGVAVGGGAVWVVGRHGRQYQVLRIDPSTGRLTATTKFAAGERVDGIAFGFGAVWVTDSSTATVYRLDSRTGRRTWSAVAGGGRSSRPEIVRYVQAVVLNLAQDGGGPATEVDIDPSTLTLSDGGSYAPVGWQEFSGELGALWWYDWPSGTLERQEDTNAPIRRIRITGTPPAAGGPCLTSITAGSQSLWLTAAAGTPNGGVCVR